MHKRTREQLFRVVPWTDRSELKRVYEELYSNSECQQVHAVGHIFVWKSRVLHKLPVAISNTATLIMAMIELRNAETSGLVQENHHKLQNSLSLALIRFVNHTIERGQTGQFAKPVHVLAAEFGIPEWIVELRHSATHGTLPPLAILKAAVNWALQWLKTEFWENQVTTSPDISFDESQDTMEDEDSDKDEENIRNALNTYRELKMKEYLLRKEGRKDKIPFRKIFGSIEKLFNLNKTVAVNCLLEEGCLLSTQEQLRSLRIKVDRLPKHIPSQLLEFWKPVLNILHRVGLTTLLVRQMVSMLSTELTYRNWIISAWIYAILLANDSAEKQPKKPDVDKLYKNKVNLPSKMLLETCIKIPSQYTAPVIKLLISQQVPPLPEQKIQKLTHLLNLLIGGTSIHLERHHSEEEKVFFLKDVLATNDINEVLEDTGNTENKNSNFTNSQWRLCTDAIDWSNIPIGCLPGQKLGYCDLELKPLQGSSGEEVHSSVVEETMETDIPEFHAENERSSDAVGLLDANSECNLWTEQDMVKLKQTINLL